MLVTNSEYEVSNDNCQKKDFPFLARIVRAFGNGFNKMIDAEINHAPSKLGTVELAMCVKQSMSDGVSEQQSL